MKMSLLRFAAVALFCGLAGSARAQIFFTGALQYYANNAGANVGGASEYDTFSSPGTGNIHFSANGNTAFAYALSPGINSFTLAGSASGSSYQGLGLYFSNTATTFVGTLGDVPNLVVFDDVNASTTFAFATNGVNIATYGQYSGDATYSGTTSYQVGGYDVTVTAFDYTGGSANLSLLVTAVPESSAYAAFAGLALLGFAAWRRKRAETQAALRAA